MVTKNEAIAMYLEKYQDRLIDEVFETPELWIISGKDKETGEELDVSPTSIRKDNGAIEEYFPPMHSGSFRPNNPNNYEMI